MAICNLTRDRLKSTACGYSLNQVVDIYLANYSDITTIAVGKPTSVTGESECGIEVTSITMSGSTKWYHIEPEKNSASYTDALGVGDGGSKYRTQTLNFNVGGNYDGLAVCDLDALSLGRFVAVVKLTNGSYIMLGRNVPLEATQADLVGSAEATGFSGIQVVMSADVAEAALPLSEEAIATVTGKA